MTTLTAGQLCSEHRGQHITVEPEWVEGLNGIELKHWGLPPKPGILWEITHRETGIDLTIRVDGIEYGYTVVADTEVTLRQLAPSAAPDPAAGRELDGLTWDEYPSTRP